MSKITQSARGEDCTTRIPGICNFNPETTVFAHIPGVRFGHGVAQKVDDRFGAYTCSCCHDAIDGRVKTQYTREELRLMHMEGMVETQQKLIAKGLM
jgi:hypothetical protein